MDPAGLITKMRRKSYVSGFNTSYSSVMQVNAGIGYGPVPTGPESQQGRWSMQKMIKTLFVFILCQFFLISDVCYGGEEELFSLMVDPDAPKKASGYPSKKVSPKSPQPPFAKGGWGDFSNGFTQRKLNFSVVEC